MAFKGERKTTTTVKVAAAQGSEASVDTTASAAFRFCLQVNGVERPQ